MSKSDTNHLIRRNSKWIIYIYILESGSVESQGGTTLAVNSRYGFLIGIDLGETRLPSDANSLFQRYNKSQIILGIPPVAFLAKGMAAGTDQLGAVNISQAVVESVEPWVSELILAFRLPSGK